MQELTTGKPPPKRASVASAAVIEGKDTGTPVEEDVEKPNPKSLD